MKKTSVILIILLIFFLSSANCDAPIYIKSGDYDSLSKSVIRLHILADGDDDISQEIKLNVRDAVLEEFSDEMTQYSSKNDAQAAVSELLGEIEGFVNDYLNEISVPYGCKASLTESSFPDRMYSSLYFPAGKYTALKITLGSGMGQNWWCVMYPPLCFTEIHDDEDIPDDEIQVRWKISEWWEELWVSK